MTTDADRQAKWTELRDLVAWMIEDTTCTTPAYGAPGHAHCAACCYGTLIAASCPEDFAFAEAVRALAVAMDTYTARATITEGLGASIVEPVGDAVDRGAIPFDPCEQPATHASVYDPHHRCHR